MFLVVICTEIQEVPCLIGVTSYTGAIEGRITGPWEDCYPGEPAEIEFEVLKLTGRPYPWLEARMTDKDYDQVYQEVERVRREASCEML